MITLIFSNLNTETTSTNTDYLCSAQLLCTKCRPSVPEDPWCLFAILTTLISRKLYIGLCFSWVCQYEFILQAIPGTNEEKYKVSPAHE